MSRRSAPVAARWAGYVAIAIVFAVACAFLSNWQFDRNAGRAAQLALVDRNYDATPVPLDDLIPPGAALSPSDEWHPVTLTGFYLPDEQLLVRNRPHGGTAAFEVLVPFELDDGRVLVVDRGWVPPGRDQPEPDSIPAPPEGDATVVVRLRPGEPLPSSGRSADAGQVPTINLDLVAEQLAPDAAAELVDSAYGIVVTETPATASMPARLESPTEDPGPHLSYAIQWILFAIMGFIFIGYVIRSERRHRREDAEDAEAAEAAGERTADAAPAPRGGSTRPKRRDRDADDEDALIDSAPARR